ncbi:MAG: imidazole glycerol phosphate synthase subunit HisH [bacterium]
MKVAIIKYNAGNVLSVIHALRRQGVEPILTDSPEEISASDKVIFPGVGEASTAMRYIKSKKLDILISRLGQPVLGICLGLQLMCSHSEENDTQCMKIFQEKVRKFMPKLKVPHIGWNNIEGLRGALFKGLPASQHTYFVHSYYTELGDHTTATTDYIVPFSAGLQKENFYAVQFHPEKSGETGAKILQNFLNLK